MEECIGTRKDMKVLIQVEEEDQRINTTTIEFAD
jgi:hypothetical protein